MGQKQSDLCNKPRSGTSDRSRQLTQVRRWIGIVLLILAAVLCFAGIGRHGELSDRIGSALAIPFKDARLRVSIVIAGVVMLLLGLVFFWKAKTECRRQERVLFAFASDRQFYCTSHRTKTHGTPNSAWTSMEFSPNCAGLNFHCLSASMARSSREELDRGCGPHELGAIPRRCESPHTTPPNLGAERALDLRAGPDRLCATVEAA